MFAYYIKLAEWIEVHSKFNTIELRSEFFANLNFSNKGINSIMNLRYAAILLSLVEKLQLTWLTTSWESLLIITLSIYIFLANLRPARKTS